MKCIQCKTPNPEGWFYCKACGCRASESKFTTNLYMGSEIGKRTDIEFSRESVDSHVKKINKDRAKKNQAFWNKKSNEFKKKQNLRYA